MDIDSIRGLTAEQDYALFGVEATVAREYTEPIVTRAIWRPPEAAQFDTVSDEYQRRAPRQIMALSRADVPTIPRGTKIVAPELGDTTMKTWEVEEIDHVEAEHWHVAVIEAGC